MSKRIINWFTKIEKPSADKGIVGWLIKNKITRSVRMANTLLLCTSIYFFVMSGLIII